MANISGELGYLRKDGTRNLTLQQQSVLDNVSMGLPLEDAIIKAKYRPSSVQNIKEKFRAYLDTQPGMVRKASKVRKAILERCLDGDSNYIAAAERISTRVQERLDPVVKRVENVNVNLNFTRFDISVLEEDHQDEPLDIVMVDDNGNNDESYIVNNQLLTE